VRRLWLKLIVKHSHGLSQSRKELILNCLLIETRGLYTKLAEVPGAARGLICSLLNIIVLQVLEFQASQAQGSVKPASKPSLDRCKGLDFPLALHIPTKFYQCTLSHDLALEKLFNYYTM